MKRKSNLFIVLGLILIIGSVGFGIYYQRERMAERQRIETEKLLYDTKQISLQPREREDVSPPESTENPDHREGILEIEKLGVSFTIYPETNETTLRDGVGVVQGTDYPSPYAGSISVIAGHRGGYRGKDSFKNVDELTEGDIIKVYEREGTLIYKVTGSKVIEPSDWSNFEPDPERAKLILLTCHPYPRNDKRLLIFSELQ